MHALGETSDAARGESVSARGHDGFDFVGVDAHHRFAEVFGETGEASCQWATASTIAAARFAGSPLLKMPEPTNTPSAPSSIMSAASASSTRTAFTVGTAAAEPFLRLSVSNARSEKELQKTLRHFKENLVT